MVSVWRTRFNAQLTAGVRKRLSARTFWEKVQGSGSTEASLRRRARSPTLSPWLLYVMNKRSIVSPPVAMVDLLSKSQTNELIAEGGTSLRGACRNRDCCRLDQSPQIHAVPTSDQLARCEWETQDAVSCSDHACETSRNAHQRRPQIHG
jgi:hypothetical protein